MDFDRVKEFLNRIPYLLMIVIYLCFKGYTYYDLENSQDSTINQKRAEREASAKETEKIRTKLKEAEEFRKNLATIAETLQKKAVDLNKTKTDLSEDLPAGRVMDEIDLEARRSGLKNISIRVGAIRPEKYYERHEFELSFEGIFGQVMNFIRRISSFKRMMQVDSISLNLKGKNDTRFVRLSVNLTISAFRYSGSEADEIGKSALEKNDI